MRSAPTTRFAGLNSTPAPHRTTSPDVEPDLEHLAALAHDAWLAEKRRRGVTTWPNEAGIEQMVPYTELPEEIREFDRIVVGAIVVAHREQILALFTAFTTPMSDLLRACRQCGRTDDRACDPPCSWVELDLCSACAA